MLSESPHKEQTMNFVGIDLHRKTISLCLVNQERTVPDRERFYGPEPERIRAFFEGLGPFQAAVEATASDERLVPLNEPLAQRVLPAHPRSCGSSPSAPARATSSTPRCRRSSWPWT